MDEEALKEQLTDWERDFFSRDIQPLYKYRGNIYRDLLALKNNQLFIPTKNGLNDPNESCISLKQVYEDLERYRHLTAVEYMDSSLKEKAVSLKTHTEATINILNNIVNDIGIFSLTKRYDIECMWAYYANGHKGFCIEYDARVLRNCFKDKNIFINNFEVKYSNERITPNSDEFMLLTKSNGIDVLRGIFASKSKSWEQEEEVRYTLQPIKESQYIDIPDNAVTGIYIGARCSDFDKNLILKTIKSMGNCNIKLYQMKFKEDSFDMDNEEINY